MSGNDTHSVPISESDARQLLGTLCVRYGFCLPALWQERLARYPPRSIDKFTDTVFRAEGLDPRIADKATYKAVLSEVREAFERSTNAARSGIQINSSAKSMFRVTLVCDGIPSELGAQAATDIAEEFSQRQWHKNVRCTWTDDALLLIADNDFDTDGEALADEFSDAVAACTPATSGYRIRIKGVTKIIG